MLQNLVIQQLILLENRVNDMEDVRGYVTPREMMSEHRRILKRDLWYNDII